MDRRYVRASWAFAAAFFFSAVLFGVTSPPRVFDLVFVGAMQLVGVAIGLWVALELPVPKAQPAVHLLLVPLMLFLGMGMKSGALGLHPVIQLTGYAGIACTLGLMLVVWPTVSKLWLWRAVSLATIVIGVLFSVASVTCLGLLSTGHGSLPLATVQSGASGLAVALAWWVLVAVVGAASLRFADRALRRHLASDHPSA
jgi:hypothetical protein